MAADCRQTGSAAFGSAAPIRRIWLCADDYGISPSVDVGIRDLIVRGRINATSVMVVAPSLHRSEALALSILDSGESRVSIGLLGASTGPHLGPNLMGACYLRRRPA